MAGITRPMADPGRGLGSIGCRLRRWSACLLLVAAPALASGDGPRIELNGFDLRDASVPVAAIERGGPPRDGIPAIDRPKFTPAAKARLESHARVLGLKIAGMARAYPIAILNWHEIVNDRFGDQAVVISYCPLCGTGMVFAAPAGSGDPRFGVSGLLYNSDVLLYDRASESLWSQIAQTAISGPAKGTRLLLLPVTHTSWADWRARHPDTVVLSSDTGYSRDYSRNPYAGYEQSSRLMFQVQHRDDRVAAKQWVLGVELAGRHKAYPFDILERAVDADGWLNDRIGGRVLRIRYDASHRSAEAYDDKGNLLPTVMAYWFAWAAFHPQTELLQRP